jgi:hypothetical protein
LWSGRARRPCGAGFIRAGNKSLKAFKNTRTKNSYSTTTNRQKDF